MPAIKLPRVARGQVLKASDLNALFAALERLSLTVARGSGLALRESAGGVSLALDGPDAFWLKVTSNSGANYAWTEQVPTGAGTWANGERSGTTSAGQAIERNGSTSVTANTIHRGRYTDLGTLYFEGDAC